jgi:hypothetical protein
MAEKGSLDWGDWLKAVSNLSGGKVVILAAQPSDENIYHNYFPIRVCPWVCTVFCSQQ